MLSSQLKLSLDKLQIQYLIDEFNDLEQSSRSIKYLSYQLGKLWCIYHQYPINYQKFAISILSLLKKTCIIDHENNDGNDTNNTIYKNLPKINKYHRANANVEIINEVLYCLCDIFKLNLTKIDNINDLIFVNQHGYISMSGDDDYDNDNAENIDANDNILKHDNNYYIDDHNDSNNLAVNHTDHKVSIEKLHGTEDHSNYNIQNAKRINNHDDNDGYLNTHTKGYSATQVGYLGDTNTNIAEKDASTYWIGSSQGYTSSIKKYKEDKFKNLLEHSQGYNHRVLHNADCFFLGYISHMLKRSKIPIALTKLRNNDTLKNLDCELIDKITYTIYIIYSKKELDSYTNFQNVITKLHTTPIDHITSDIITTQLQYPSIHYDYDSNAKDHIDKNICNKNESLFIDEMRYDNILSKKQNVKNMNNTEKSKLFSLLNPISPKLAPDKHYNSGFNPPFSQISNLFTNQTINTVVDKVPNQVPNPIFNIQFNQLNQMHNQGSNHSSKLKPYITEQTFITPIANEKANGPNDMPYSAHKFSSDSSHRFNIPSKLVDNHDHFTSHSHNNASTSSSRSSSQNWDSLIYTSDSDSSQSETEILKRFPNVERNSVLLTNFNNRIQKYQRNSKRIYENTKKTKTIEITYKCLICFCLISDQECNVLYLKSCSHSYHDTCLQNYLEDQINQSITDIKCPSQECKIDIAVADIKRLISLDMQEKFENFSLKNFFNKNTDKFSCCPTSSCTYYFEWYPCDNPYFTCPKCTAEYCLNCRSEIHPMYTCEEFRATRDPKMNEIAFENFVHGAKFKKCSKCQRWIEKNQGCNHMSCLCGNQFCYLCGLKWKTCSCS